VERQRARERESECEREREREKREEDTDRECGAIDRNFGDVACVCICAWRKSRVNNAIRTYTCIRVRVCVCV